MAVHTMLYLKQNSDIPRGRVTSSARKGRKWFDLARAGDTLVLQTTEDSIDLGRATVTKVELVDYIDVLHRAPENHTGQRPLPEGKRAFEVLAEELHAAYGMSHTHDPYTMVHFIRVNE